MDLQHRSDKYQEFGQTSQLLKHHFSDRPRLSLVETKSSFVAASYIAVLGFAEAVDARNRALAFHTGRLIAESGHGLLCGNAVSTFDYALIGAEQARGQTQLILTADLAAGIRSKHSCYFVSDSATKHRLLVKHARAAVVIGGGSRTLKLVDALLDEGKPVVAIAGTGGVVRKELPDLVPRLDSADEAVSRVVKCLAIPGN